ncbi:MAG: hypothetical protein VXZ05_02420 [Pseudomonadota bacterium]|nr:hypothetical protein [Pseudomonadota bacterium]|tara:strand:+ start:314 stop:697 length:384 start_codon:yes stop_codon:yes gene_type:complete
MPLYTLAARERLDQKDREQIAGAIVSAHCGETDAPEHFVNVIIQDGVSLKGITECHISGVVRLREASDANTRIANSLRQSISDLLLIEPSQVAIELTDIPATWAMEGGEILPEPGQEDGWMKHLERA